MDPTDASGLITLKDGRAVRLPIGQLEALTTTTVPTLAFFDEIGQAPPAVQAAIMSLFLARQIGESKVSDLVTFIGATNEIGTNCGVTTFLEPLKSRAVGIYPVEPDLDDSCNWYASHDVQPEMIAFVRLRPQFLTEWTPTKTLANTCNPRVVYHASKIARYPIPQRLLYPALERSAGKAFAAEYCAFLDIWRNLPDLDAALANPKTYTLPDFDDDPSTAYAMSAALGARATKQNIAAVATLLERMPQEYMVFAWSLLTSKHPELTETASYIAYIAAHQELYQ